MATHHNPEKEPRTLSCDAWEAMLADALDGTLNEADAAAFAAHSEHCKAGCAGLLEEATRGREWLRFLQPTPEAPAGLLEKILAETSGSTKAALPVAGEGALAQQPWLGVPIGLMHRHAMESRILMTLAMAFFSVALTLNLAGVRLKQIRLDDLKPSSIAAAVSHQYYTTSGQLARHYMNLRIVYELESRVNDMRRTSDTNNGGQPKASGKPGGAAKRSGDGAIQPWHRDDLAPLLADFSAGASGTMVCSAVAATAAPGNMKKQERSLA